MVLSACNTAIARNGRKGAEVESFAVLAQKKGASSVLATLWPVEDKSTGKFMRNFYSQKNNNPFLTKAEILRQTQLTMLEIGDGRSDNSYSHPFYWAPFVLMGNWW